MSKVFKYLFDYVIVFILGAVFWAFAGTPMKDWAIEKMNANGLDWLTPQLEQPTGDIIYSAIDEVREGEEPERYVTVWFDKDKNRMALRLSDVQITTASDSQQPGYSAGRPREQVAFSVEQLISSMMVHTVSNGLQEGGLNIKPKDLKVLGDAAETILPVLSEGMLKSITKELGDNVLTEDNINGFVKELKRIQVQVQSSTKTTKTRTIRSTNSQ